MSDFSQTWGAAAPATDAEADYSATDGADISTHPDLDPSFSLQTGPRMVAEAIYRRLTQERGGLFYDANYGVDLRQLLNESIRDRDVERIAAVVEAEVLKDERVLDAVALVEYDSGKQSLTIRVEGTGSEGPFRLTLEATSLSVAVLRME